VSLEELKMVGKVALQVQAIVVDHIIPHRGNKELFWNRENWQPLCRPHHDRKTTKENS
jgi:5-methylcytosine-specific restriction protein A